MYHTVYRVVNATGIVRETDNRAKALRLARIHSGRVETLRVYDAEMAESRRIYREQRRAMRTAGE